MYLLILNNTRRKVSGSSSRFQGGKGNRLRTRQGQGKDKNKIREGGG